MNNSKAKSRPNNFVSEPEDFKKELQELRLVQGQHLNYTFFPDLGHGGRTLHRLASIKIIDQIGKLNAS